MSSQSHGGADTGFVRETYEEFEVGESVVAMIADPQAQDAWIQSDVTSQVVP